MNFITALQMYFTYVGSSSELNEEDRLEIISSQYGSEEKRTSAPLVSRITSRTQFARNFFGGFINLLNGAAFLFQQRSEFSNVDSSGVDFPMNVAHSAGILARIWVLFPSNKF